MEKRSVGERRLATAEPPPECRRRASGGQLLVGSRIGGRRRVPRQADGKGPYGGVAGVADRPRTAVASSVAADLGSARGLPRDDDAARRRAAEDSRSPGLCLVDFGSLVTSTTRSTVERPRGGPRKDRWLRPPPVGDLL